MFKYAIGDFVKHFDHTQSSYMIGRVIERQIENHENSPAWANIEIKTFPVYDIITVSETPDDQIHCWMHIPEEYVIKCPDSEVPKNAIQKSQEGKDGILNLQTKYASKSHEEWLKIEKAEKKFNEIMEKF